MKCRRSTLSFPFEWHILIDLLVGIPQKKGFIANSSILNRKPENYYHNLALFHLCSSF